MSDSSSFQPPPLAPPTPGPPLGFWYVAGRAEYGSEADKALLDGVDELWDDTELKMQAIEDGLGLRRQRDPAARLAFYLQKPATNAEAMLNQARVMEQNVLAQQQGRPPAPVPPLYSWETQRAFFPNDYEIDWQDFQNLRERAAAGEFA